MTFRTGIHALIAAAFLATATSSRAAEPVKLARPIAILGAMPLEVDQLRGQLADRREQVVRGIRFDTGTFGGRKVVLARSGIGGVNAGVAASLLLEHFEPSGVLFTGVAGGLNPDLGVCDIVVGKSTVHHDFGEFGPRGLRPFATVSPLDGKENPLSFPADKKLLDAAVQAAKGIDLGEVQTAAGKRQPRVVTGVIATGNSFVASAAKRDELRKTFKADAAEMEGAAVAQVCWQYSVPCLVVRSLSDDAGEGAPEKYERFEKAAATNSAKLVRGIVAELGDK